MIGYTQDVERMEVSLMAEPILLSNDANPLRPIVEGVIAGELRSTKTGIQIGEARIQVFEKRYGMASSEFLRRYENDELQETLDLAEWTGEIRMLAGLKNDAEKLQSIEFWD
jgi:hypothetical protein